MHGRLELVIEMLQRLFAKLNEKLLGKPPFRFLHGVVMAFVDELATGLYGDDETDPAASAEGAEAPFLEKIVKLVGTQLNTYTTDIKPAKVVGPRAEPRPAAARARRDQGARLGRRGPARALGRRRRGRGRPAPAPPRPSPRPPPPPSGRPRAARAPNLGAEPAADARAGAATPRAWARPTTTRAGPVPQLGGGGGSGARAPRAATTGGPRLMLHAAGPGARRARRAATTAVRVDVKVDERRRRPGGAPGRRCRRAS